MKIAAFEVRPDEKDSFARWSKEYQVELLEYTQVPTLENAGLVAGCEGVTILGQGKIDRALLGKYRDLGVKYLSTRTIGSDHIDLEACKKRGITVCNAAGYSTEAVAELTIGMMIAVYRKMVGGDAILRIGGDRQGVLGSELHGKTVGIVGLGAIGQRVALLANAFGCKVLGYNRSPKALPHITQVDKDTLLRQSDIITVHLPLNPETKAFIGTNEFALMQPHAVLINTARGPIVSQEALYNALKKGQIAGAAVDVYDQEPPLPLNLELFNAPNLLMLPHMGYATREAFETRLNIVIRNIEMWLNNTPQNQVL